MRAEREGLTCARAQIGNVMLWDCARGELRQSLGGQGTGHTASVTHLAFSVSGATLYAASADGQVTAWQVSNGAELWSLKVGKQPARRLAVHPDDDVLVSAASGIKMWDVSTRKCARKLPGHASPVVALAFSPCGAFLASGARPPACRAALARGSMRFG